MIVNLYILTKFTKQLYNELRRDIPLTSLNIYIRYEQDDNQYVDFEGIIILNKFISLEYSHRISFSEIENIVDISILRNRLKEKMIQELRGHKKIDDKL